MTPAIEAVEKARLNYAVHEYEHNQAAESYGLEAAEQLGVEPARVFKTLLVSLQGGSSMLAVGIVPVDKQLDLKSMAAVVGVKKARMAEPQEAERATGYVLGGISPLGQKKRLLTILDETAMNYETVYVSAGRRGLEIELSPRDLISLSGAHMTAIAC